MSFISRIFRNNGTTNGHNSANDNNISEELFIEKEDSGKNVITKNTDGNLQDNIHMVYSFLSKDYQQEGYDDALVHPDISYKNEKIREIQGDLDIVIRKAKTYYEDAIRELDFLIISRNRLGMVDMVDELKMRKEKAQDHYAKIIDIQKEAIEQGESHRLLISYNRGFQNGMAAIAIHELRKNQF